MLKKLILKMLGAVDKSELDKFKSSCNEFMLDYLTTENAKLALNKVQNEYDPEAVVFATINYSLILWCEFKEIRIAPWASYVSIIGCRKNEGKGE